MTVVARDPEIDRLNEAQQLTFADQQRAYLVQQAAWERMEQARRAMSEAFHAKQHAYRQRAACEQVVAEIRGRNSPQISELDEQSSAASHAVYEQSGKNCCDDDLCEQVTRRRLLVDEIRSAQTKYDQANLAFRHIANTFAKAKQRYEAARDEHVELLRVFRDAQAAHQGASRVFMERIEQVKHRNSQRASRTIA